MLGISLALSLAAAAPALRPSGVTVFVGLDDARAFSRAEARVCDVRRPADSIILLRPAGDSLRALWIPKETLLRLPGGGSISAGKAVREGGVARLDAAICATFGLVPQHHALLDFRGSAALVDAMGGMRWPGGANRIGLPASRKLLFGREAASYARADGPAVRADILRIRRQMALAQTLKSGAPGGGVSGMLRAAAILPSIGRTDLSPAAVAQLALSMAADPLRCAILAGQQKGATFLPAAGDGAGVRRFLGICSARQDDRGSCAFAGSR